MFLKKVVTIVIVEIVVLFLIGMKGLVLPFFLFTIFGAIIWNYRAQSLENDLSYLEPFLKFYRETDPTKVTDSQLLKLFLLPEDFKIDTISSINLVCHFGGRIGPQGYWVDSYNASFKDDKGKWNNILLWESKQRGMPKSFAKVVSVVKPWLLKMAKSRNIEIYENVGGFDNLTYFPTLIHKTLSNQNLSDFLMKMKNIPKTNGIKIFQSSEDEIDIQILFGYKLIVSQLELHKDSFVIRKNDSLWSTIKSLVLSSGIPPIWKTYNKPDILNFGFTEFDISVSTLNAVPQKLIWVSNKTQREILTQLLSAWLGDEGWRG